jgi:hypothetical protein
VVEGIWALDGGHQQIPIRLSMCLLWKSVIRDLAFLYDLPPLGSPHADLLPLISFVSGYRGSTYDSGQ